MLRGLLQLYLVYFIVLEKLRNDDLHLMTNTFNELSARNIKTVLGL